MTSILWKQALMSRVSGRPFIVGSSSRPMLKWQMPDVVRKSVGIKWGVAVPGVPSPRVSGGRETGESPS